MILDPHPCFQAVWLHQKYWCLKNAQKDVDCRRGVKGWLAAKLGSHTVIAGHQSARMVAFRLKKNLGTHWPEEDDFRPTFLSKRFGWTKSVVISRTGVLGQNQRCWFKTCFAPFCTFNQIDPHQFASCSFIFFFRLGISDRAISISPCFEDGNVDPQTPGMWIPNMFCRFPIVPLYLTFLSFLGNWDQAALKSPGLEGGNLDRPKPGMLVPNMSCTFVQIPHHDLVPFSALQINGLFFWSVAIYTTRRLIKPNLQGSHLIASQGFKIIVAKILEPSTATPRGYQF